MDHRSPALNLQLLNGDLASADRVRRLLAADGLECSVTLVGNPALPVNGQGSEHAPSTLYKHAIETSNVGILIADAVDSSLPLIYVNRAFERITGYSTGEALGRGFLHGTSGNPSELAELRAALSAGREIQTIVHCDRKDGSPFWCELALSPVRNENSALTHYVGFILDVNERMDVDHALKTSETRLRSVLESVLDGIIVIDERGNIESFNPAAERIFGYQADEVLAGNVSRLMPEPDASAHDGYLRNHLETGNKAIIDIGREVIGRRKDGSTFPMDLAVSAMRVGEKRCFTGVVRDISARKRIEGEMIRSLEAAEAANRAKSEFQSSMNHELRTPMNAILGYAQLLARDPGMTAEQADNVREILLAGRHLLALINEALDLAHIESGRLSLHMELLELEDLIDECSALVEPNASRQELALHVDLVSCRNLWLRADRLRLKQVLMNLLSNAVKFNREGGSVRIGCELRREGRVRLMVADTGPGIPEDRLADLFIPFNRIGREAGTIQGSGIGLVIAKLLVESMGGEIGIDNRSGHGCTFWIEFPKPEHMQIDRPLRGVEERR